MDLEVREAVDDLDLVVGEGCHNLPLARRGGERGDLLHLQVGKAGHFLNLEVRERGDNLDFAVALGCLCFSAHRVLWWGVMQELEPTKIIRMDFIPELWVGNKHKNYRALSQEKI